MKGLDHGWVGGWVGGRGGVRVPGHYLAEVVQPHPIGNQYDVRPGSHVLLLADCHQRSLPGRLWTPSILINT